MQQRGVQAWPSTQESAWQLSPPSEVVSRISDISVGDVLETLCRVVVRVGRAGSSQRAGCLPEHRVVMVLHIGKAVRVKVLEKGTGIEGWVSIIAELYGEPRFRKRNVTSDDQLAFAELSKTRAEAQPAMPPAGPALWIVKELLTQRLLASEEQARREVERVEQRLLGVEEQAEQAQNRMASVEEQLAEQRGAMERLETQCAVREEAIRQEAARQREALEARLAIAEGFAPAIEEHEVMDVDGALLEKQIRIACPGVAAEQVCIDEQSIGVRVEICRAETDCEQGQEQAASGIDVLFGKAFEFPQACGRWELCSERCGLENGVLVLVLRRAALQRLRFGHSARAPLLRIPEQRPQTSDVPAGVPNLMLSRSSSLGSITTVSSGYVMVPSEPEQAAEPAQGEPVASESAGHLQAGAQSAPPPMPLQQCLLADSQLLAEDGSTVPAAEVQRGFKLCALRSQGETLEFRGATVKAKRLLPARDRDLAEVLMTLSEEAGSAAFVATADHQVLMGRTDAEGLQWMAVDATDIRAGTHQPFLLSRRGKQDGQPLEGHVTKVKKIGPQWCEVVELELEQPADTIFVAAGEGIFVAVFGCLPRPDMEAVVRRGLVDVQFRGDGAAAARSSQSWPQPASVPRRVYRTIRRPHDEHCVAWCRYHFKHQCKSGLLCPRCHDPEHLQDSRLARTHRGKRR